LNVNTKSVQKRTKAIVISFFKIMNKRFQCINTVFVTSHTCQFCILFCLHGCSKSFSLVQLFSFGFYNAYPVVKYKYYIPISVFAVSVSFSAFQLQILLRLYSCHKLFSFIFCCPVSVSDTQFQILLRLHNCSKPFSFNFCHSDSIFAVQFQFLICSHSCSTYFRFNFRLTDVPVSIPAVQPRILLCLDIVLSLSVSASTVQLQFPLFTMFRVHFQILLCSFKQEKISYLLP
jgi:hypothetical protein